MAYNWTNAQSEAIYTRDTDILVSAGAGSGKTAVLIERIVSLITDSNRPLDIDKILVVTFTKAAAEEMRFRLHSRLSELLLEQPHNTHLQRQIALLPSAEVNTLHSFCLNMLKHHFALIGLDSNMRIGKDHELAILRSEVLEEYMEKCYASEDKEIYALADIFGGSRDDSGLTELVDRLYNFCVAQADPLAWLDEQAGAYADTENISDIPACRWLLLRYSADAAYAVQCYEKAIDLAMTEPDAKCIAVLNAELAQAKIIAAANGDFAYLQTALDTVRFDRLVYDKRYSAELKNDIQQLRDKCKELINDIIDSIAGINEARALDEIKKVQTDISALCRLVKGFYLAYRDAKQERGLIDFADMEHYCLDIIHAAAADGEEIIGDYAEVLVDEYQDINNVQETIIREMSANGHCFMVGDIKQAIYQFRLADTGLFSDKQQLYKDKKGGERIILNTNYRSLSPIIDAVNFLFSRLMTVSSCSIDYSDGAALQCGRPGEGEPPEFYLLNSNALREDDDETGAARIEARFIASRIQALRAEGAKLSDIVILHRSANKVAGIFIEELNSIGIAAVIEKNNGCIETPEISQMLSLLRVLDNPFQDIELAAVMRGPFGGFSSDEFVAIRTENKNINLYTALCNKAAEGMPKAERLCRMLHTWGEQSRVMRISALIRSIYNDSGFYQYVGALTLGAQRQANLDALYDKAGEFEDMQAYGLFRFVNLMNDMLKCGQNFSAAKVSDDFDAVRIMTVHKSKGLQFPIVFIAGMGKAINMQDKKHDVLIHKDFGICARVIDRERRIKYPTLLWSAFAKRMEYDSIAEEMRVLYVAMTRAQDKLIMVGCNNGKIENFLLKLKNTGYYAEAIDYYESMEDRSYLKWLCRALYAHQDAEALRAVNDDAFPIGTMPSNWHIEVINENVPIAEAEEARGEIGDCSEEERSYIAQLLSWHYPHAEASALPMKWTVTELQKMAYEKEHSHYSRGLFDAEPISSADLGSAYHKVLELMDFSANTDTDAFIHELCDTGVLDAAIADSLDRNVFDRFLHSELGKMLAASAYIEKERAFTVSLPAHLLHDEANIDDDLILQGKIDLFFYDESRDAYIIVDYKSGNMHADEAHLHRAYGKQMLLYKEALQLIYKKPVAEVYLYLLNRGEIVKML